MIPTETVREIERLLALDTLSQRKIARLTHVSRAVVASIADGTRPDYEAIRLQQLAEIEPAGESGPLVRCPGCGGRVYAPCRLCRVRRLKADEEAQRRTRRRLRLPVPPPVETSRTAPPLPLRTSA